MSITKGLTSMGAINMRLGEMPSAARLEMTDRLARNIVGGGSTRVSYRNGKIIIQGGSALDTWMTFGFTKTAANSIKIAARAAVYHSSGLTISIPEQTVLLSGSPCWVYASINRQSHVASVCIAAARPASDNVFTNLPMYQFSLSGSTYTLVPEGRFDFNFFSPLA